MPQGEAHNHAGTVGASGALVWGCACMFVCLSITGLLLKYTGLSIVTVTWRSRLRTRRIEDDAKTSPRCMGRRLTAQQKDRRRQDNGDKKRLTRHHPSDLLRSLTRERIGRGQHSVVSQALQASPFQTFHVLRMRHLTHSQVYTYKSGWC